MPESNSQNRIYAETNLSAGSIAERIKYILDLCNIDYENVVITYSKTTNSTNSNAEKTERHGQLKDKGTLKMIPNELIGTIMEAYKTGMRFDDTVLRLLEDKTGMEINESLVDALRETMFMRSDGLYYLPEMIAGSDELDFIKSDVTAKLNEYTVCESACLYEEFSTRNFSNCLRDEKDYANFLEYLLPDIVRGASIYGTKVIKPINVSKGEAIGRLTEKLALKICENGCLTEDELLETCPVISRDFMAKIIKKNTNDIVTTVINDMVCYQTIEMMGFDENFSDMLCNVLDKIDELNLVPSQETLKVLLSVEVGQNFFDAYSITDDKTFCRIIDKYYTGEKARAWQSGNYAEVE